MSAVMSCPRLRYLFNSRSGRAFIVPMDHGIGMGPLPGLYRVGETVRQMAGTGVNAVVLHKGLVRTVLPALQDAPDVGLVVHLSASTTKAPDGNAKQLVCGVEEALAHGADAVSVHINVGAETEGQMLSDCAEVVDQCRQLGVPLLAMVYARGPLLSGQFSEDHNILCARIGYELGADLVKVLYTGSPASFERVVRAAQVPVVIAGGPHIDSPRAFFEMVHGSLQAGGQGLSIGRNVFGAANVSATCQALAGLVHDGLSVDEALDLLETLSRKGAARD
jgi:class I fructose-bisphosphate aldolase